MKMRLWIAGLVLAFGLGFAAPGAYAGDKEDVAAAAAKWQSLFALNDPDKILSLYANDGVLWGTLSPTVLSIPLA